MDFLRKAKDRVEQTVGEQVGSAAKTEFDADFVAQLAKVDDIRSHTEKLLNAFECHIQPDSTTRLLPGLMTGDKTSNTPEVIGSQMRQYSDQMAKWTTKSAELDDFDTSLKYGEMTFKSIGQAERDFISDIAINFTAPIKQLLSTDIKIIDQERKTLNTYRVDMDSAKNKALKNPQLAPDAERATNHFTAQLAKVKELIVQLVAKHGTQMQSAIKAYVAAKLKYLDAMQEHLRQYQTHLH